MVALKKLQLNHVSFSYHIPQRKTAYAFLVDNLALGVASLDLGQRRASAKNLWLSNSDVKMSEWVQANIPVQKSLGTSKGAVWSFNIDAIGLSHNSFSYQNAARPRTKGVDLSHIDLKNYRTNAVVF